MNAQWIASYYDAIFACVERYRAMAKDMPKLAVEAQKLIDEWNRGELNRGEFEIMMRELIRAS